MPEGHPLSHPPRYRHVLVMKRERVLTLGRCGRGLIQIKTPCLLSAQVKYAEAYDQAFFIRLPDVHFNTINGHVTSTEMLIAENEILGELIARGHIRQTVWPKGLQAKTDPTRGHIVIRAPRNSTRPGEVHVRARDQEADLTSPNHHPSFHSAGGAGRSYPTFPKWHAV